ncbi:hypothetical protein NDU88_000723 [Pleurodeles waltl]|uniref:Uncharacterized protein n=1 Tax=Pleurodeles waltl TaxID=8319 RepID=A0AAV7TFM5_PLEWA|nr:hypothetical protein NDU88_000723 [Pleurodeles waltl]
MTSGSRGCQRPRGSAKEDSGDAPRSSVVGAPENVRELEARRNGRPRPHSRGSGAPLEAVEEDPVTRRLAKILSVWFGGPGAAGKSWNERLAKVKQKLGLLSLRNLSIEGKAPVLSKDSLPVLLYVTQAWPLLANVARANPTEDQRGGGEQEACRKRVHNLLRDYTAKDNKESEKEEEL